jgi:hypothetical protein
MSSLRIPTERILEQLDDLGELGQLSYEQRTSGPLKPSTVRDRLAHTRSNRRLMIGTLGILLALAFAVILDVIFAWGLPGFVNGLAAGAMLSAPAVIWRLHRLSKIEGLYDVVAARSADPEPAPVEAA